MKIITNVILSKKKEMITKQHDKNENPLDILKCTSINIDKITTKYSVIYLANFIAIKTKNELFFFAIVIIKIITC